MKYKTLTAVGLFVGLIVGLVAQQVVYVILSPGAVTDFVATVIFFGGFLGGLLGFVGFFRVREGKPFLNKPF